MFRFVVWKSLFYLTRKTSYRAEAGGIWKYEWAFAPQEKYRLSQEKRSRAQAGIQVVLILTTVIFVVADESVAMPLSPPTRNNYFRRRPRATERTRDSFSRITHSRTHVCQLKLSFSFAIDWIIKNMLHSILSLSLSASNYEYSWNSCGTSNATAMRFT